MSSASPRRLLGLTRAQALSLLSAIASIAFFVLALLALRHELQGLTIGEVRDAIHTVPLEKIILSLLLVFAIYVASTGYDALAFIFIRHKMPYRSIAFTSFIGHALANNIGFSALLNSSVRLRFYLARGVTAMQVLQVVAFGTVTFWLGFSSVATAIFLFAAPRIPPRFHVLFPSLRPVGFLCLAALVFYLVWSSMHQHKEWRIRGEVFRFPPLRISLLQILVSATEWTLGAAILYTLLPHLPHVSFASFVGIFLLAQISGLISQVPGGIGVFESIVIARIPGAGGNPGIVASLIIYRLVFNLIPLLLATVLLGARGALFHRRRRVN